MLASKKNGTLYIGVTSDIIKRVWQQKDNEVEGFTKKYQVHRLVGGTVSLLHLLSEEKQLDYCYLAIFPSLCKLCAC